MAYGERAESHRESSSGLEECIASLKMIANTIHGPWQSARLAKVRQTSSNTRVSTELL